MNKILPLIILLVVLSGCAPAVNPLQKDLDAYKAGIGRCIEYANKCVGDYNSLMGAYKSLQGKCVEL